MSFFFARTQYGFLASAWISLLAMILGFLLDLLLGDPACFPHPVRLIGLLISGGEKLFRRLFPATKRGELAAGAVLTLWVVFLSALIPFLILAAAYRLWFWLGFLFETVMCYQIFAVKALRTESMKVYDQLEKGDLPMARHMVSMIVGRDTQNLDPQQVTKAAVETVAESAADGIISPMLFLTLCGPWLGFAYKAVNTLDSMVGYRNDAYLYFGRASARLDDLVNLIPARLAGLLMVAAAPLCGFSGTNAWRIFRRDRRNHKSPNSAHTEAACAGALCIQLAGDAYYFGKLVEKPTIGDPVRPVEIQDIPRANRLTTGSAVLGLVLFSVCKAIVLWMI